MRRVLIGAGIGLLALAACQGSREGAPPRAATATYFDTTGRADILSGGVRLIPIHTPKGDFRVWTKRVGNNPRIKVLLLHGGPGASSEYFEALDSYFPGQGIEYYYYDQLGSYRSDVPTDTTLWTIPRFVDEVEQVRVALGLDKDNFYLLGHSWGGILAMEYALAHQDHLKGLIISNMMASIPAYNEYAKTVLMPAMNQDSLRMVQQMEATGKTETPEYMAILTPLHYEKHFLRMPAAQWPDPALRGMGHLNRQIYVQMQGPSELGASGSLEHWDRLADLGKITVPTLTIGGEYDTMDPKYMEMMAGKLAHGRYLYCPGGTHMSMYDAQATYMTGLIKFIEDVDAGRF